MLDYLQKPGSTIKYDIYSPIPLELVKSKSKTRAITAFTMTGGIMGGIFGFLLQYFSSYYYLINSGGKPFFHWLPSLPLIFIFSILFAFISTFFSYIIMINKLKNKDLSHFVNNSYFQQDDNFRILIDLDSDNEEIILDFLGQITERNIHTELVQIP